MYACKVNKSKKKKTKGNNSGYYYWLTVDKEYNKRKLANWNNMCNTHTNTNT